MLVVLEDMLANAPREPGVCSILVPMGPGFCSELVIAVVTMSTDLYQTDVFVAGGGPAGLAAAIAARQQGLQAAVADYLRPPIDKACGEGLMPDSVAALEQLGVDVEGYDHAAFRGIKFIGPDDCVSAEFPGGQAFGIRRTVLHRMLLDRARELGVEMLWGSKVEGIEAGSVRFAGRSIQCKWVIGADGHNSSVRRWAGLDAGRDYGRRVGIRQHFALPPWSEFVEIYWGSNIQAYVTPVSAAEICVALISKERLDSFSAGLTNFAVLAKRLRAGTCTSAVRGSATVSRRLQSVTRDRIALVGEASGSVDAITGGGLGMAFRQAAALGRALAANDLSLYETAHRELAKLPHFMNRSMLLMDASSWVRERALRSLATQPRVFARLLSVHVGEAPLASFAVDGLFGFGWHFLHGGHRRA